MRMTVGLALAALLTTGAVVGASSATATTRATEQRTDQTTHKGSWVSSWATAEQYPRASFGDSVNWSLAGFENQSIRQVVRISRGGSELRIQLSNAYGTRPLKLAGATIGRTRAGAAVDGGSLRQLRFGGSRTTTIPVGGVLTSDALPFRTKALESLTVTLYLKESTGAATHHEGALATTYRGVGDHRFDTTGSGFSEKSTSWYYLTAVHVKGGRGGNSSIIAFGDSLTDGWSSSVDTNNRYPDELAEMLVDRGTPTAVANLGINGSKLRVDSPCFGERGLSRFHNQVLRQPNAGAVIVSIGLNDIGTSGWPTGFCGETSVVSAADVIDAHRAIIRAASQRGLRILGATLTPLKGSSYYSPEHEQIRDAVNAWIRSSGEYDAVLDFERTLAAPTDEDTLNPIFDSGDHLRPNDAGRRAMAEAALQTLQ